MSKTKKIVLAISLVVILACGVWAAVGMGLSEPTYDGSHMDLVDLYENNSNYDNSKADGAASIIVNENLEKTAAENADRKVATRYKCKNCNRCNE